MMTKLYENLKKILVVGAIYDKISVFSKIKEMINNYDLIIINGNISHPFNEKEIDIKIDIINELISTKKVIYNLGDYDYKLMISNSKYYEWFQQHSNIVIFDYKSNQSIIVTNGGITNNMTKKDLLNNIEATFVSKINNEPWHKQYGGGFGYIISNNPLTMEKPKFYNFSAQIGNVYLETGNYNVFAQEVLKNSLGATICL